MSEQVYNNEFDSGTIESCEKMFGITYHDCYMGTMSFDESFNGCPLCGYGKEIESN